MPGRTDQFLTTKPMVPGWSISESGIRYFSCFYKGFFTLSLKTNWDHSQSLPSRTVCWTGYDWILENTEILNRPETKLQTAQTSKMPCSPFRIGRPRKFWWVLMIIAWLHNQFIKIQLTCLMHVQKLPDTNTQEVLNETNLYIPYWGGSIWRIYLYQSIKQIRAIQNALQMTDKLIAISQYRKMIWDWTHTNKNDENVIIIPTK